MQFVQERVYVPIKNERNRYDEKLLRMNLVRRNLKKVVINYLEKYVPQKKIERKQFIFKGV